MSTPPSSATPYHRSANRSPSPLSSSSALSSHVRRKSEDGSFARIGRDTEPIISTSPTSFLLSSPSAVASSAAAAVLTLPAAASNVTRQTSPKLIRLALNVWPLPLRSKSTYAILLGLVLLILVIIDKVLWHLISESEPADALTSAVSNSSSQASFAAHLSEPAFILHLLRHSFTYRVLLCSIWIIAVFAHGIYIHGPYRRRGVSKKRRSTVSSASAISSTDETQPTPRKTVSFASEELPATPSEIARPATKKRLRIFMYLALVLAVCGIAFEVYLAVVAKRRDEAVAAAAAAASAVSDAASVLPFAWNWVSFLSFGSRALLVALWCAFCGYCCYFLWWRKAIGTRKTKGRLRSASIDAGSMSEDEDVDEEYEDGGSDSELDEESVDEQQNIGDDLVQEQPIAQVSAPASPSARNQSSATVSASEAESDASDSESDSDLDPSAASFPVPSAQELLMYEKLDSSLFFHPEQEQNQYSSSLKNDLSSSTQSAASVTAVGEQIQTLSEQQQQAAAASAKSPSPSSSPPPIALPLSTTSPLLHSTLYHLASSKFIANLSPADFARLLPELQWLSVPQGGIIYQSGERVSSDIDSPSDGLFILVHGTVGAVDSSCPSSVLTTYHQGDSIGELEFLFNQLPRALTMVALTNNVQLLRIPTKLGRLWSVTPTPFHFDPLATDIRSEQVPRSDILLSYVRTTLARQWRSAEFILQHFLELPLPAADHMQLNTPISSPLPVFALSSPTSVSSMRSSASNMSSPPATMVRSGHSSRYFTPAFASFFSPSSDFFRSLLAKPSNILELSGNATLFEQGNYKSDQLFVVLSGRVWLSTTRKGEDASDGLELGSGSVLNAISYFTDTVHSHSVRAASSLVQIAWLNREDLSTPSIDVLRLALTVCEVLAPTLAQFQNLGFERNWIRSGTLLFKESQPCESLYVIANGRVRIVSGKLRRVVPKKRRTPSSLGGGSAPSASPTSTTTTSPIKAKKAEDESLFNASGYDLSVFTEKDTYLPFQRNVGSSASSRAKPNLSAKKRIRFELGSNQLIGEVSFLNSHEQSHSACNNAKPMACLHSSSALCTKDAELIKISRACFEKLIQLHPRVLLKISQILAKRLGEIMRPLGSASTDAADATQRRASVLPSVPRSPFLQTAASSASNCMSVCLLSSSPLVDLNDFALNLSLSLANMGRTILLTKQHVDRVLGEGTCANLHSYYHRSLFTYWLSHIESHYSFCLFVAEREISPWTMQCQRQADLTLILANADDSPEDDADDEEEDDEDPRKLKRKMRAKRVTPFERLAVWNEEITTQLRQQQKEQQERKRQQQLQQHTSPSRSTTSVTDLKSVPFSPTLNPTPIVHSPSAPINSGGAKASTPAAGHSSHGSLASPRLHFSVRDLILLHPNTSLMPRGTRFWCAARPALHRFHHIQRGCREHLDRLARYIAGKTVGVVLSGGGARGLSHLGVLNSFAEQGVPIDYVGGTSQGSFMAALYAGQAQHHTQALQQMASRVHTLAVTMGSISGLLADATFPMLSYFAGRKFGNNIASILGEYTRIEDLWLPYYCVTTNLSQADSCVHERGVLWKAVRASMTVLDYLPPMQISKKWPDLLIDGGYTSNLPIAECHGLFQPCYVIGVDVENKSGEEKIAHTSYYGPHLSGWWLLKTRMIEWIKAGWIGNISSKIKRKLNPKLDGEKEPEPLNLPKFAELISSLIYINHNRNIRQSFDSKLIDLYIRPDLGTTALLDYHLEEQIVSIGYQCTKVKLTEWRLRNSTDLPKATPATVDEIKDGTTGIGAPLPLQRTNSNQPVPQTALQSTLSGSPTLTSQVVASDRSGAAQLTRRKTSAVLHRNSIISKSAFLTAPSLTFTHDLTAAQSSPVQRSLITGSPIMRTASSGNLAQQAWGDFTLTDAEGMPSQTSDGRNRPASVDLETATLASEQQRRGSSILQELSRTTRSEELAADEKED